MIAAIYEHGSFVFFIYVCLSLLLGMFGLSDVAPDGFWKGVLTIAFEVSVGAGVTIVFIDRFNAHRERESLKRRLIREAGSRSHDVAISAFEWMDREGWLRGEDGLLKGANLREARLWDARMDGANLEGADLEAADLRNAKLIEANLNRTNLFRANLEGASLRKANLQEAKLSWANLNQANLDGAHLQNAELSQTDMRSANLNKADFEAAFMLGAELSDAHVVGTSFRGANLLHAKVKEANWPKFANFEDAKLSFIDLRNVDLDSAKMKGANLYCADLRNAKLQGTDLECADLQGAYLQEAQIRYRDIEFTVSSSVTMPHDDATTDAIEKEVFIATNFRGAILPDGTLFSDEMENYELMRFVYPMDERFAETLEAIKTIRKKAYLDN